MMEREGDDGRALELHIAAAEEDETDLAVRDKVCGDNREGVRYLVRKTRTTTSPFLLTQYDVFVWVLVSCVRCG